ncbi:unnamed protein product [Owenia fusiformis]|uniref:G-protein coupled receptors family 1 profile domain-containing protein n=1 Tax=Owenia fusiformis TaxID=6347 RepID=A0A8S4P4C1_OWEFU|nr:unnamed protein product [Owenia fusiformis]
MNQDNSSIVFMDKGISTTSNGLLNNSNGLGIAKKLLRDFLPPILLTLGTIGNALSLAVLCRKKFRKNTTSVYLITLAVVDILAIWLAVLPHWQQKKYVDLRKTVFGCTWMMFLRLSMTQLSAWILVLVTFERLVAVFSPLKVKIIFNVKRAVIILAIVIAVVLGLNIHILWNFELRGKKHTCRPISYKYYLMHAWLDGIAAAYIPSFLMLSANIAIIAKMHMRKKSGSGNSNKIASMTIVLLLCNFSFIFLTFPFVLFHAFHKQWYKKGNASEKDPAQKIHRDIVHLLAYSNQGINFLLYCASGQAFREEIKKMFYDWKRAICGRDNRVRNSLAMNTNIVNTSTH